MTPRRHVIIFAKEPRLGRGKRRLAKTIGPIAALRFQKAALARLLSRLTQDRSWRVLFCVAPDAATRRKRAWPKGVMLAPQGAGDLGQRMARALRALPPGPALLIGSDIPDVTPQRLRRAFRLLGRCDAVFGPAQDGGYWLVGLKRVKPVPDFRPVRWSSAHALADTVAAFTRQGFQKNKIRFLEMLEDVDDAESFTRYRARRSAADRRG